MDLSNLSRKLIHIRHADALVVPAFIIVSMRINAYEYAGMGCFHALNAVTRYE